MTADEQLLRLLRAVKRHEPGADGDHNDASVAQDYADAFDEDAVLLCLNALQAATDAGEWLPSEQLTTLVGELLDWDIGSLDLKHSVKSALLAVRWRFLTRAMDVHAVSKTDCERLLARMAADRFAALDVQYAIADCLAQSMEREIVRFEEEALELVKQFYVTLDRVAAREQLSESLVGRTCTKDDVKLLTSAGLLRAFVQVIVSEERAAQAKGIDGDDDDDGAARETLARLAQCGVRLLRHVASLVCLGTSDAQPDYVSDAANLCDAVVQLMLSRVSVVFEEAARLLQMLVESLSFLTILPTIPDLRGALEKAKTLATKPEGRPTVHDSYVRALCEQLHALLVPQIDEYEKRHGSLVGLSASYDVEAAPSAETALQNALDCKARGNAFYQRGNFATARLFYRRAISIVRAAEFQAEQKLSSLPVSEMRKRCSVGASVQVVQRDGSLRSAMVVDVEEEDDLVEVMYDDGDEEEERVPLGRLRLRMDTSLLEQFKTVAVDCAMNMGKAFTMLFDYETAVECFTHVLTVQPQYIAALYHRGVACLVLHDLRQAQTDLWQANQLCGKWKTMGVAAEAKKKTALHGQIVAAYKKLQALHASKKKVDKKLVKQMLGYISSIPGIQDGEEEAEVENHE